MEIDDEKEKIEISEIKKVSSEVKNAIERKSVQTLPNRPSEMGFSASEIKRRFFEPILASTESVITEIDRVIGDVNSVVKEIEGLVDSTVTEVKEELESTITSNHIELIEYVDEVSEKLNDLVLTVDELATDVENLEQGEDGLTPIQKTTIDGLIAVETTRAMDIESNLQLQISARDGVGGSINAYDFKTANPTQTQLFNYALSQIPLINDPHEIWNATHVTNTFNGDVWQLNNTPTTTPPIYEWVNIGSGTVAQATNTTLGTIKGGTKITVNSDGSLDTTPEKIGALKIQDPQFKGCLIGEHEGSIDLWDEGEGDFCYLEVDKHINLQGDIDVGGTVRTKQIFENGQRVYSVNNPPPITIAFQNQMVVDLTTFIQNIITSGEIDLNINSITSNVIYASLVFDDSALPSMINSPLIGIDEATTKTFYGYFSGVKDGVSFNGMIGIFGSGLANAGCMIMLFDENGDEIDVTTGDFMLILTY
jgi:hypothetical protein